MADSRPRNRRPRRRGGKGRLVDQAVVERQQTAIHQLEEALRSELVGTDREEVERVRQRAVELVGADAEEVVEGALDELFGLGPLERLLRDPSVRTLHVHGRALFENDEPSWRGFRDEAHARAVMEPILRAAGVDPARGGRGTLGDGSTVQASVEDGCLKVTVRRP